MPKARSTLPDFLENIDRYHVDGIDIYRDEWSVIINDTNNNLPAKCISLPKRVTGVVPIGEFMVCLLAFSKNNFIRVVHQNRCIKTKTIRMNGVYVICCLNKADEIMTKIIFRPINTAPIVYGLPRKINVHIDGRAGNYIMLLKE